MTFEAYINDNLLYRSPDGREAWIIFRRRPSALAFITTDIHGNGQPNNSVGFSAATLRQIADRLDGLVAEES